MKATNKKLLRGLGLVVLAGAAMAAASAQTLSGTRASGFEYDAHGMLSAEVVEPGTPDLCVRTAYTLDAYGNRQATTTSNCTGASAQAQFTSRTTTTLYETYSVTVAGMTVQVPAGAFTTTVTNAKGHVETRRYDPRFGGLVSQTGPNGLSTTWQYDELGRKVVEVQADGNKVVSRYCVLAGQGDGSANSAGCQGSPAYAPAYAVSYVESQPQDSAGSAIGPYVRKYMDALERVIREETQGFDGGTQPANARVIVKDTEYNDYGAVARVTQPYFIDQAAHGSTTGASAAAGWVATTYDALGRPKTLYVRDDEGNESYLGQTVARKSIDYAGLVTTESSVRTSKNAQGQQQPAQALVTTTTKDPLGRVIEVKDALNATLRKRYDAFDNVVETQDALDNRIAVVYDTRGRKTQMADPNAGTWNYRYDALGQLTGQQNAVQAGASQWTTMVYDALGRMQQRTEPGDYVTTWSFDSCTKGVGKLCQVQTDNGLTRSFSYDALGRLTRNAQSVSGRTGVFATTLGYDSKGRLSTYTYPTGVALTHVYSSLGFLAEIKHGSYSLWRLGSVSAWSKPEMFDLGAGTTQRTVNSYDPLTGRAAQISAGAGGAILQQAYGWDTVGNLTDRSDLYQPGSGYALTENFGYDELNRLFNYQTSAPSLPGLSKSVVMSYNAIGSILGKSDVGSYTYAASGPSSVRPNAVASISGGAAGARSYSYDAAGNLKTAAAGRYTAITYTSFNLPKTLAGGSASYDWAYGEDHQRVRETRTSGGATRVTWYDHPDNANGLAFEQELTNGGPPINRHYVSAMGRTIAVLNTNGQIGAGSAPTTVTSAQYWHVDQLGSVSTLTNEVGAVSQRYSYDPFGKRREPNGNYDVAGNLIYEQLGSTSTDRGFTGHEHLDDVGIVHMNGRTYDPLIARFMQADSVIAEDDNLQTYNRFSYVANNPLNATDPSGNCPICLVGYMIMQYGEAELIATALGGGFVAQVAGAAASAMIMAGAQGATVNQTLRAGASSAAAAVAFDAVGGQYPNDVSPAADFGTWTTKVVLHAAVGCAQSSISGGSCRDGAVGAGVAQGFAFTVVGQPPAVGLPVSALIGGAASKAAGGKFANGAITASFGYLFNQAQHESERSRHAAFAEARRAAGIPDSAIPIVTEEHLYDGNRARPQYLYDKDGRPVMGRVYTYDIDGRSVVIQEHSIGHMQKDMEGKWAMQESGHFNVRDASGNTLSGTRPHYEFKWRIDPMKYFWRRAGVALPRGGDE